jgi:hypothetical protein
VNQHLCIESLGAQQLESIRLVGIHLVGSVILDLLDHIRVIAEHAAHCELALRHI